MEITVFSLGSGSKGNCHILSDGKTSVMIDAGLTTRGMKAGLDDAGMQLSDLEGILLTHEHADHVRSLPYLSEVLPVYSHEDTLRTLDYYAEGVRADRLYAVEGSFQLGGFYVTPFRVSHDAAHPFGFIVENGESKVGYLTDTGYVSKGIMKTLSGCDTVILESNHDKELLLRGGYPEALKRRILSDKGHLCNDESAECVCDLVRSGAKKILLAHISENNNLSELAYWTTRRTLESKGIGEEDVALKVAYQRKTVVL